MPAGQFRPKRDTIDKKQFESLCAIQCTREEIEVVLDVSRDTLRRWCEETYGLNFKETYKLKRQLGKASLRRRQWNLAEKNTAMAIWLGKQWLGQKDKIDVVEDNKYDVQITNIADLINNPKPNRTEDDV